MGGRLSKAARPRFTDYELARNRICRRNGWTIESEWDNLSEWEQSEWLADDHYLQQYYDRMIDALIHHGDHNAYSPEIYAMIELARIANR